jgi:hypothetical protein
VLAENDADGLGRHVCNPGAGHGRLAVPELDVDVGHRAAICLEFEHQTVQAPVDPRALDLDRIGTDPFGAGRIDPLRGIVPAPLLMQASVVPFSPDGASEGSSGNVGWPAASAFRSNRSGRLRWRRGR